MAAEVKKGRNHWGQEVYYVLRDDGQIERAVDRYGESSERAIVQRRVDELNGCGFTPLQVGYSDWMARTERAARDGNRHLLVEPVAALETVKSAPAKAGKTSSPAKRRRIAPFRKTSDGMKAMTNQAEFRSHVVALIAAGKSLEEATDLVFRMFEATKTATASSEVNTAVNRHYWVYFEEDACKVIGDKAFDWDQYEMMAMWPRPDNETLPPTCVLCGKSAIDIGLESISQEKEIDSAIEEGKATEETCYSELDCSFGDCVELDAESAVDTADAFLSDASDRVMTRVAAELRRRHKKISATPYEG